MTKQELRIVRKHIHQIYSEWHGCKLGTKANPLHPEDKKRGLKIGQLCDDCENMVTAHMKDIETETGS